MSITTDQADAITLALSENPSGMTLGLARRLGVPEAEVIRRLPDGRSRELDVAKWRELFDFFATLGTVHVIVSNSVVTCETVGEFGGFSVWEEFFNVQSPTLDMHIRWTHLGSAFAVEKPSHMDGGKTLSVQFFDKEGVGAMKVFFNFAGKPKPERVAAYEEAKARFGA